MEVFLKVDDLKPSVSNVRSKHSKEDIAMMADSIKHRGLINPLTVAKNGEGKYEVIAGLLRYKGAVAAGIEKVRCEDVSALTKSERVELSLSENIDRRDMSAIEYFVAFNQLFKAGMSIPTIGSRFNKSEREVQQLLAIGSLPKKILDLAERGEIGDNTLKHLAIASGKDVTRYMKLSADQRPKDWDIHHWLAGADGMYLEQHAIFDLSEYKGPKMIDLFGDEDEVWLTDGAEFLRLQGDAIMQKKEQFIKRGWQITKVDYWNSWQYQKTAKADGGKVYYTRHPNTQEVNFYVGYTPKKGTGKTAQSSNKKDKQAKAEKPEISKEFAAYMAETRHQAVCRRMIEDRRDGLIAAIILLLKRCDNISFHDNNGLVRKEELHRSLSMNDNSLFVIEQFDQMNELIGNKNDWKFNIDIAKLANRLYSFKPAQLQKFLATILAHEWTLIGNADDSDAIGKAFGLSTVETWVADNAFWNGISSKNTLLEIAAENKIDVDSKATIKVIRSILKDKVSKEWRPKWLDF